MAVRAANASAGETVAVRNRDPACICGLMLVVRHRQTRTSNGSAPTTSPASRDGLENVLCPDFEFLIGLSLLALMAGCLFEGTPVGTRHAARARPRHRAHPRQYSRRSSAPACAFFFISIWAVGGILLTPELKTNSTLDRRHPARHRRRHAVAPHDAAVGARHLRRCSRSAIWNYGIFHLADYPVFLGVAAYLALTGLQHDFFGARPIDVVRWAAGITLMWASIEKWAYPEWSYPLFIATSGNDDGLRRRTSSCARPAPSNSRWRSR